MDALDLLHGVVLEGGQRWGDVAVGSQRRDAEAVLRGGARRQFSRRPRGGSKSVDLLSIALAWLAADAPAGARGYVVTWGRFAAEALAEDAARLTARSPAFAQSLRAEKERIMSPDGAYVRVLDASAGVPLGLGHAHLVVLDDLDQWAPTEAARRAYAALSMLVEKTEAARLAVFTSQSEPSHWSRGVHEQASAHPAWRVSAMPGPVAWHEAAEIEALRRCLSRAEFDRLVLNVC